MKASAGHDLLIAGPELSSEYSAFIEGLSDEEVEVLVNIKQRLDEVGIAAVPLGGMPVL